MRCGKGLEDRLALVTKERVWLWFCEGGGTVVSFHGVFRSLFELFLYFFEGFILAEFRLSVNLAKQSLVHIDTHIFHLPLFFNSLSMQIIEFITADLFIGKQLLFDDIPQILVPPVLALFHSFTLYFLYCYLTANFALLLLCLLTT